MVTRRPEVGLTLVYSQIARRPSEEQRDAVPGGCGTGYYRPMPRKPPVSMFPVVVQRRAHARAAYPAVQKLLSNVARVVERLEALQGRDASLSVTPNFLLADSSARALKAHLLNLYADLVNVASSESE